MLEKLIEALKAKQLEIAVDAMRLPGDLSSAQYARSVGRHEGLGLALVAIEQALDKADKRDKEL